MAGLLGEAEAGEVFKEIVPADLEADVDEIGVAAAINGVGEIDGAVPAVLMAGNPLTIADNRNAARAGKGVGFGGNPLLKSHAGGEGLEHRAWFVEIHNGLILPLLLPRARVRALDCSSPASAAIWAAAVGSLTVKGWLGS